MSLEPVYSLKCSAVNRSAYVYLNGVPVSTGPTLDLVVEADVTRLVKSGMNELQASLNEPTADENEVYISEEVLKEPEVSVAISASDAAVFTCLWTGRRSDAGLENIAATMSRQFDLNQVGKTRIWQQLEPLSFVQARSELLDLMSKLSGELSQGQTDLLQELFAPAIEEEQALGCKGVLRTRLAEALAWMEQNPDRMWEAPRTDYFLVEPACHGRLWRPQLMVLDDQQGYDGRAWLPSAQNPRLYFNRRNLTPERRAEWKSLQGQFPRFEIGPLHFGKLNNRWIAVL